MPPHLSILQSATTNNAAGKFSSKQTCCSISVSVALERSVNLNTNVVCLFLRRNGQLSTQRWQVQCSHLFIEMFRKQVDLIFVAFVLLPIRQQVELAEYLVGKGARHHEGWMASSAAQVEQAGRGEH